MKKILFINVLIFLTSICLSQDALMVQNGGSLTIQSGAELHLQGGVTLDNGSNIENYGTIFLKNNSVSNNSNWTDNSILGALTGTGIVIFNSTSPQQFTGPTNFYTVYINTDQLSIYNDLNIVNLLRLIKGKINTANYVVALVNTSASSLDNDITNAGYSNSWINGNFKRSIATNTSTYDFPVGNSDRSNLLKFINNNLTGPSNLTSSFIPKPGTDAGLNVVETGNTYTAVNSGGVWKLIPNTAASGGNYALQLYFNGFTGLIDNRFGILRRPDASTDAVDWIVPTGSLLETINGIGRRVSDGFARRFNISDFSQFGIGEFNSSAACEITGQSAVCTGSTNNVYSAPAGLTSYFWTVTGSGGIIGSNTEQTVSITAASSPGNFTVNLLTTLNGVAGQCSKDVTVTATPTCDITGPNELCAASTNNTYSGPANMTSYSWTASAGLLIVGSNTGSSVNVTAVAPGPQVLTLNATGDGGCIGHCTKSITIKPIPPCNITGESNLTTGTSNNQYTGPVNMSSYNWSISGNGSIVGSNTGSTISVTASAAGNFTLTLTTTLNGCSLTCNKNVTVDPLFTYSCDITGTVETCHGVTETFTAPANLSSYEWNVTGNGVIVGSNNSSSVTVNSTNSGSYIVSLQTTLNEYSCSSQKTVSVYECVNACTHTQGFYGNPQGTTCYSNSGGTAGATELILNAFTGISEKVFGNVANKRFFTLSGIDITNGNIYKMLPGGGNASVISIDNTLPYNGAFYADASTWSLVPLQPNGPQKGRIRNSLLAQTITLWFNIANSSSLGTISLAEDTLVVKATSGCGSTIPVGTELKFGLPHEVVLYLNGGNGYTATVNGLFELANDVLGGVNQDLNASVVSNAVDVINNAFDGCRILARTIPYAELILLTTNKASDKSTLTASSLKVTAYPNPYHDQFQLLIHSPVSGIAKIEFYNLNGQKVYEMRKALNADHNINVPYTGPKLFAGLFYRVTIKEHFAAGMVLKP